MDSIRHHFGFKRDPFPQNVAVKELFPLPALKPLLQRVTFAIDQKAIAVVTGDVGSGKVNIAALCGQYISFQRA
jgi:general secretion pathway protein A